MPADTESNQRIFNQRSDDPQIASYDSRKFEPDNVPIALRLISENLSRSSGDTWDGEHIRTLLQSVQHGNPLSVELFPTRIVLPDSSGLPAMMDLAALRDWAEGEGVSPSSVNPVLPIDLVIDHSLIVEHAASKDAQALNLAVEYKRNNERYAFLKWAGQEFDNLRIVPPGQGIIHQINIERLAKIASPDRNDPEKFHPEFVLGCDSHTTMINGLGVLGWGVGGIEAEATLIGLPYAVTFSSVVGVKLTGRLSDISTATDLALLITNKLREFEVRGALVEFFGLGARELSVFDRTTIANMAPEYGATTGFFAFDDQTSEFLKSTGRRPDDVDRVTRFMVQAGFSAADSYDPKFPRVIEIDIGEARPAIAGPTRPQDYLSLDLAPRVLRKRYDATPNKDITNGSVVLAAITSCTNTAHPASMITAGLLAQKAVSKGLSSKPWIKTSFAPGSKVVDRYLTTMGLQKSLDALGFQIVGHACTTCSGKSGPLNPAIEFQIAEKDLDVAAVLSGNRNFPGRIHKSTKSNFIMSPALVVAFALTGRIDFDFENDPIGEALDGTSVLLADIWPSRDEVDALVAMTQRPEVYDEIYDGLYQGDSFWDSLKAPSGHTFGWNPASEYLKRPPFFQGETSSIEDKLTDARALVWVGDDVTTDQVTPSGEILVDSAAGEYLAAQGVARVDFNAVTQRRGNHEVMRRVTFANQRFENKLAAGHSGGVTRLTADGGLVAIHEAADAFTAQSVPAIVLAGARYGTGSSRDWAAKGPWTLGVRAVIAVSFERIHRRNLVCMGILPLVFESDQNAKILGLTGFERFSFSGLKGALETGAPVFICANGKASKPIEFTARLEIAGTEEAQLLSEGGIFSTMKAAVIQAEEDA